MNKAEDYWAIQILKSQYCAAADLTASDVDAAQALFAKIFADDVTADYGIGLLNGRQALSDFLVQAIGSNATWIWHAVSTPLITLDGDEAVGEWTVQTRKRRPSLEEIQTGTGRYKDRFIRTTDGWKISHIGFTSLA